MCFKGSTRLSFKAGSIVCFNFMVTDMNPQDRNE